MSIKVGDIVEYHGTHARVMRIEDNYDGVRLVELAAQEFNVYAPINELTLIKSVQLSDFQPGDLVVVHNISTHEKDNYTCGWMPSMEFTLDGEPQEIKNVTNDPEEGYIVQIRGYWFSTYHITHVQNYDIV